MSDPFTPPPEEPLPEQSRARIRADLLAAAQDGRGGTRGWLAPLVAAAAVLVVVGVAGWAVQAGGDDNGAPAGAPTSSTPTGGADWYLGWPDDPEPSEPSGKATLSLSSCADPVGSMLPGAEQVVEFPADDGGGSTTVWVAGERFALCDVRAGTTTVQVGQLPPREAASTYDVSAGSRETARGSLPVWVAGGRVPDGAMAFDLAYTFPDGHVEHATTTTDDEGRTWWRVVYSPEGEAGEGRIQVTVRYSGAQHDYTLQ